MKVAQKKTGFAIPDKSSLEKINRLTVVYICTSFVYLLLGIVLGVGMLVTGNDNYLFTHVHLLLIGFVIFLIYGVGYKLLPTMFFGYPGLPFLRLPWIQYAMGNAGLIIMVLCYNVLPLSFSTPSILLLSGLLELGSALLFVYIMVYCVLKKDDAS